MLASELAWGDTGFDGVEAAVENGGLSPAARRPLWRMSEEEQQVKEKKKTLPTSVLRDLMF